ncbi:hypothetical protein POTOM_040915 [Populus tomentosa]|uniref:Uncharacterized protein n=1 Tax=Populus tomentosa TaxID=118781 RepID=A0A8X7YR05_POPTO|nr:hypothetical protein POTOM_040915 [Populus tomentosa]
MVAIPMSKSFSNALEGYASFTGLVTRDCYMDSLDVKELQNFQDCSNLRLLLWVRIVLFPSLWILTPESFRGISLADTQWNWNAPLSLVLPFKE